MKRKILKVIRHPIEVTFALVTVSNSNPVDYFNNISFASVA